MPNVLLLGSSAAIALRILGYMCRVEIRTAGLIGWSVCCVVSLGVGAGTELSAASVGSELPVLSVAKAYLAIRRVIIGKA